MWAGVDAVGQPWVALLKDAPGLLTRCRETLTFPDFVEPPGIALIAAAQVDAACAQPAGDPDVDGVGFGQWAASGVVLRCEVAMGECGNHGAGLTQYGFAPFIARDRSERVTRAGCFRALTAEIET